jgi:nitric oxide reductase subunit C
MIPYKKYAAVLLVWVLIFMAYNLHVYFSRSNYSPVALTTKALEGEALWLGNNCNSCHQLYGLGGYLGPDLTNVYSLRNQNDAYIKAMMVSAPLSMPQFNFTEAEQDALLQYLKEVDATGEYPSKNAQIHPNGWIELHYKDNSYGK